MTYDLILVGFGNVARRFARLLDELRPDLMREHGIATRIVAIATRSRGCAGNARGLGGSMFATLVEEGGVLGPRRRSTLQFIRETLSAHTDAARSGRLILVEATTLDITRGQPATDHVLAALRGGAHVISPNKGPAAFAYDRLSDAAWKVGRRFLFESAVLDGVPVFNLKRGALPVVNVLGFQGVVNSTTNYMLTAMEHGETFDAALAAMQRAGTAEADATLDLEGWDAAAKTAVMANVLLGASVTPDSIARDALTPAVAARVTATRAVGRRLKLVASAEKTEGVVRGRVKLTDLPETDLLASLEGQQNALVLHTDVMGEIAIVQRGSGLTQTAYGLVSDLVTIAVSRATRPQPRPAPPGRSPSRRVRRKT